MKEQQQYVPEHQGSRTRLTGQELIDLFCVQLGSNPSENSQKKKTSREVIKGIAEASKKHIGRKLPGSILNNHGAYSLSEEGLRVVEATAQAISVLTSFPDQVRLPEMSGEREMLARILINALVDAYGKIHIITPVCPDYGKDAAFYRSMGGQIGSEARAAIIASQLLHQYLPNFGIYPHTYILVADTEDDKPEILANCAEGDVNKYHASCQASARAITNALREVPRVTVSTFSEALGDNFRTKQYAYEDKIRSEMRRDLKFRNLVTDIAQTRVARHSQILNRPEYDFELTIRYMAQYAALGSIARAIPTPAVLMNYETPNRAYFNAAVNRHSAIQLSADDMRVIPVLGTVRGR